MEETGGSSMDMTAVTDALTAAGAAVAVVGAASLIVYVGSRVWKMIRGAV